MKFMQIPNSDNTKNESLNSEEGKRNPNLNMKNTFPGIDPSKQKFPYCITWSPLPPITWIFPFIGHTGICSSDGTIYDFAGPYTIGVGRMAFGPPTRYIRLDPSKCGLSDWDNGVREGCEIYKHRMHNICCDNCHSHVAECLNIMGYGDRTNFEMLRIGVWFAFWGRFVSFRSFVVTYLPFSILLAIILIFSVGGLV